MDKRQVTSVLEEIAVLLELKGENTFKIRAYQNAARSIESLAEDLQELVDEETLTSIKGIGKGIAQTIEELVVDGQSSYADELREDVPEGLLGMLRIPGLGPKRVKAIHEWLEIETIGELEYACLENRLVDLEGFGAKTQDNVIKGIEYLKRQRDRHLIDMAEAKAHRLLEFLRAQSRVKRCSIAGSLRRRKEVVKDIDLLASSPKTARQSIMKAFTEHEFVERVVAHGDTKSSVTLASGINVDLRLVTDKEYPYALHHFTGSREHNTAMRMLAKSRGMKMNEYGLFQGDRLIACRDEEAIFKKLKMDFIPPELREDMGEIDAAQNHTLPHLIEEDGLRGVFHVHTTESDGSGTLEDMVNAARTFGYEYLGVSDHSQSANYAHGLDPKRLRQQRKAVGQLNGTLKNFTVLHGSEVDILTDGSLDFTDRMLSELDFVIASVHSNFRQSESVMTKRVIKAMKNKHVTMLGHPTGRLLLARDGYAINMREVISAAADLGVAIEINANPHRLDLDWRWGSHAQERGLIVAINPDAHQVEGFEHSRYGIGIARKAWYDAEHVLNSWPVDRVVNFLSTGRKTDSC